MKDGIMVSITVLAYNHKDYIAQCIEGILSQKTQYKFELLIHDDASTDGTAEIVRAYEQKYPEIIHAIYEEENQHSKGINIWETFFLPLVRGRYVASCDGDDYWIDEYKLQKQVDFMLDHCGYIGCCTNALVKDYRDNSEYLYCKWKRSRTIRINDVLFGKEPIMKPSTWIINAKPILEAREEMNKLGGYVDAPTQAWMMARGKVYFMKDTTIVYRLCRPGSWTATCTDSNDDRDTRIDGFNELTNYKYDKYIRKCKNREEFRRLNNRKELDLLSVIGCKRILSTGCVDLFFAVFLYKYCPHLYGGIKKIWRKLIHED